MKSKIIRYLRSISQEPFALSNLDLVADGQVVQFPHSFQVVLRDIQWNKGQWKGLIQDIKGNVEWALINDPSWNPILNERKRMGFKPVPVSILRLERMKQGLDHSTFRKNETPTLVIHSGIYDNKWLVNASSFGSFLRCPRIIFLKHRGLYQPRSPAAVKGSLIHEFHVSLYQNLKEEYQSNPSELYEMAEIIKEGIIQRAWRDLVSVNLTAKQGRDFILTRVFVDRMLDAPEFIPWSSEQILSEFWLSSLIFGIQGFVDRLSLLEDGKIAVFELKSGRQPELKVKAAKYQAAAYAMMLLSLGLKISTLVIEFPEAQSPREERFIIENLFPRYFDQIPKMRNGIYHLQTSQEYSWFVFPWKNCNKACFIKRACQFYCYFENHVTKTVDERCSSKACQFLSVVRAGDYYCLYPKIMNDYPISLDLIDGYLSWYRKLLLEEKQSVQEEINNVILPAFEREKSGNALADMEFVGRDEFSSNVFVFRKKKPSSVIEDEDYDQNREAKHSTIFPSLPPTRMQPGDPVLITPMNKLPRSQYSFRGRIYHMTSTNVLIEVDERELTNDFVDWDEEKEKFLSTDSFRIDLLPSVTTIQTQLKAMDILSRAPFDHNISSLFPNALKLRNLLIFVQKPRFTEISQDVKEEVESLPLNERQKRAILQALRSKDFILIHGPPGSGKTTTICHLISQILLHQKEKRLTDSLKKLPILVTGFTRKSVDNMVTKWQREFAHYGKLVRVGITSSGNESEVDAVSLEKFVENEKKMGIDDSIDLPKKVLEILNSADIIATTAASALTSLLESYQFQTVIVDEAGQCTEPLTIVSLLKGDRFILVGDHIQLPPVVAS